VHLRVDDQNDAAAATTAAAVGTTERLELLPVYRGAASTAIARMGVDDDALDRVIGPPHAGGIQASLRSWLWFVLEHEVHHKAQLAEYLRALGRVPPYFAMVLPAGMRPDIEARAALDGV